MKKNKLLEELKKIFDTGKLRMIKKYNLSLLDINIILNLLGGKYKTFLQSNVALLLKDYGYDVQTDGVGFILNEVEG